jgi:hypothetical protein
MFAVTAIAGIDDDLDQDTSTMWLDGGSTHHIICSRKRMMNCTASTVSNVIAAGGESHHVRCCGQVILTSTEGLEIGLTDVLCVPTFKVNLVSETQLMSRGVSIYKIDDQVTLADSEGIIFLRGNIEDDVMKLQCQIVTQSYAPALSFAAKKDWGIYHQRLGHPSMPTVVTLLRSNAILGVPYSTLPPADLLHHCRACAKAKQHRASFKISHTRCTRPMHACRSCAAPTFRPHGPI